MKKQIYLILFAAFFSLAAVAQCPNGVAIKSITQPTACGNSDGKFTIAVTPAQTPALYESSYDGGLTWFQHTSGNGNNNVTGKAAGVYKILVRNIASLSICSSKDFILRANYPSTAFTATPTAATGCNIADGKIVLAGGISATDSVSWLSAIKPVYTKVGDLVANTIPQLKPGVYYIILKSPTNNTCFSTQKITVGNSGVACPAPTLCTNAFGANKFPNGDFGSGTSLNGPALPAGETTYGYTQLASDGPDDGFYAIANTTDYNGAGGKVFNVWTITTDHTGNTNGYMMIVNASFDQDVVSEKTITGLCPNKTYQFSAYIRNIKPNSDGTNFILPNLTFLIDGVGRYTTGDVTSSGWVNIGFTFKSSGTNAKFSIRNNNPGGNGNDWVIDDIFVGVCAPTIVMNPVDGSRCSNPATSISATITDVSNLYDRYKWQVDMNDGNGYVDATNGSGNGTFDLNHQYIATLIPTPSPLTGLQNGWKYRLIVAEDDADFLNADCNYLNTKTLVIAQCGAVLPVKITSLKAEFKNAAGKIYWQVAEQININQYQVEKSNDGINFSVVTSVASSENITNYSAEDNAITTGINYYRIKMISVDGKYAYSPLVTLVLKGNTDAIKIFPNPVKDRLFIWSPVNKKISRCIISDAVGQKVIEKTLSGNSTNISDIEVSKLQRGIYNIQVISNKNEIKNFSFIKQ